MLIPSPGLVGRVVDYRSKGMGFELRLDRVTYLVAKSAIVFDLRRNCHLLANNELKVVMTTRDMVGVHCTGFRYITGHQ